MKLLGLRRVAIKRGVRIRFTLPNGLECLVDDQGVVRIPSLTAPPDFNLDEACAGVDRLVVETPSPNGIKRETCTPQQLLGETPAPVHAHAEED